MSLTRSNLVRLGVRLNAKSGRYCTLQTQTALMPLIYKSETGVIVNSILSAKVTQSKAAGLAWVEVGVGRKVRFTLNCGGFDWIGKMAGKATRIGLYKCYQCRKQFTVKGRYRFRRQLRPERIYSSRASDYPFTRCSSNRDMLG